MNCMFYLFGFGADGACWAEFANTMDYLGEMLITRESFGVVFLIKGKIQRRKLQHSEDIMLLLNDFSFGNKQRQT